MRPWVKSLWGLVQYGADCVVLLACWAVWVALAVLLVAQLGIATSREFAVPDFVLRSIEARFTASDVKARFGHATFNPTGAVLLENVSLSLPEFNEPVVTVRALLVHLDPWLLLGGKLEVQRVQASGVTLSVPAMLAASGQSEAALSALDFSISPLKNLLNIEHLTARIAGVDLDLQGQFQPLKARPAGPVAPLPLIANLAQNYAQLCRQLTRIAEELSVFEEPRLQARLTPSADHGAIADVRLTARTLKLPRFHAFEARELSATLRIPLLGDAPALSPLTFVAEELRAADGTRARAVHASAQGLLNPTHFSFVPQTLQLSVAEASARGFALESISSRARFSAPSTWVGDVLASAAGSPIAADGEIDFAEKSAAVNLRGAFAPQLLEPIGAQLRQDVRRFVDFGQPVLFDLRVAFHSGWKFQNLAGHIAAREIDAYDVAMDSANGEIEFDGRRFYAHDATAVLGENIARGSFEQDLSTLEFRFLLEGRLRPLAISGWFGPWWPGFFGHFQFPAAPPQASVDVAGRWHAGHETSVFVFAESLSPEIRGTALDYGRTLMFIRPHQFDGLEAFGTRGAGQVRGTFMHSLNPERTKWNRTTFALTSTLDLATGKGLLGPELAARVPPITFTHSPQIKASGQFDGPAAAGGEHQTMRIEARSTGAVSAFDFPASDLFFDASLRDDELTLDKVEARIAGGFLSGRAQLTGPENARRLHFDASLSNGLLGEAVTVVSDYSARRRGKTEGAAENFMPGQSQVKMDLSISAAGNLEDVFSYHGTGKARLSGAELGEVRLLGLLSELLDFTALRFTTAELDFQLAGRNVIFPSLSVTGANSAIEGHGDYSFERGDMDFNARVFPFQESKSVIQNVVGVMLMPLSTMLEVKLTGPLKQPKWAFVIGPTNFFRSITQPGRPAESETAISPPSAYLKR